MPDDDETLIRLRLLSVPEVRRQAGFPETGPLTVQQISDFSGLSRTSVHRLIRGGLAKLRIRCADLGIAPTTETEN